MKTKIVMLLLVAFASMMISCERVAPNYAGVLMTNYGKDGKSDFSLQTGRVNVMAPGTELFQVPLFDQRGEFKDQVTLKSSDNTEFTARPSYSYRVIRERAIDVVFDNKHIGSGDDFMESLEDNIIEPRIYDLIKEESRRHKTDELMCDGGSLSFEKKLEEIVGKEFNKRGLQLISFSAQIEFSSKVREKRLIAAMRLILISACLTSKSKSRRSAMSLRSYVLSRTSYALRASPKSYCRNSSSKSGTARHRSMAQSHK